MDRSILFSTKTKYILIKILLLVIIFFAGIHLILEQRDMHIALHNRDNLRTQDEALHAISEDLNDELIGNALANEVSDSDKIDMQEQVDRIIERLDKLDGIEYPELQFALDDLKKARSIFSLKAGKSEIQEGFLYLNKARLDLRNLDEKLDKKIEAGRLKIRAIIEKDPYTNLWILFSVSILVIGLALLTAREIFNPMALITKQVLSASEDTSNILNYLIQSPGKGEVGSAQKALNNLFLHVAENIQALKNSNITSVQRLAAIEAIKDGVGMVDENGILTYANKSLLDLHGILPDQIDEYVGKSWDKLYTDKGKDEIRNHVLPALQAKGYWQGETVILRKDNATRNVEMSLTLLDNGSMIGTARDITRRKQAEREQGELHELFAQSQKMEAVGRLTGGVAHDFNNILTIIGGNLDLIKDVDLISGSAAAKFISTAERAVSRGAELTQRLLSFSRKQVLLPRITDINSVLPDTLILLSRAASELIDLQFDMAENLWSVKIDVGQMENALLNLVINARDAMQEGGTIKISTENAWLGGQSSSAPFTVKPGPYVKLSVTDTGHGIPDEILLKVFDPFFTTKRDGKGTGLGLSMVYGFAKQSGGYVMINSSKAGTEVSLYFPRYEGEEKEPLYIETVVTQQCSSKSETILVAEDEEDVLELSKNMLSRLGYRVLCAKNGTEALKFIESDEPINLLLTDMVMPGGISGKELVSLARTIRPEIGIIIVSGYTSDLPELPAGQNIRFLPKPYTQAKLSDEIARVLNSQPINTEEKV